MTAPAEFRSEFCFEMEDKAWAVPVLCVKTGDYYTCRTLPGRVPEGFGEIEITVKASLMDEWFDKEEPC